MVGKQDFEDTLPSWKRSGRPEPPGVLDSVLQVIENAQVWPGNASPACGRSPPEPPWSRVEGNSQVNLPQMPPLPGGIRMGVDYINHPFASGLLPGRQPPAGFPVAFATFSHIKCSYSCFAKVTCTHKSVNISYTLVIMKDQLTNLCGNALLQNDITKIFLSNKTWLQAAAHTEVLAHAVVSRCDCRG